MSGVSFRDIFLQKLLARIILADASLPVATATYTLVLGVNVRSVVAEVALVWLLKLSDELDCEARPAKARRLGREVDLGSTRLDREELVDLDRAKLDRDEDRDNTRPRLEADRSRPSPPAPALRRLALAPPVSMGRPVAASRRRR